MADNPKLQCPPREHPWQTRVCNLRSRNALEAVFPTEDGRGCCSALASSGFLDFFFFFFNHSRIPLMKVYSAKPH